MGRLTQILAAHTILWKHANPFVSQGFLNLMLPDGTPKDDVKVPEGELGKNIEAAFEDGKEVSVTIIAAMGMSRFPLCAGSFADAFCGVQVKSRPWPSRKFPPNCIRHNL
jgi:hypothetical protein